MPTILDGYFRKHIIDEIKRGENAYRKERSWKQYRVMTNDYEQYVAEKLAGHLDSETVIEMPKIASINIASKIVQKTAVVYQDAPQRSYSEISDDDEEVLRSIYKDGKFNQKLRASNKSFKYQNQNLIYCVPNKGRLTLKSLKLHQYDVIPMDDDPEVAKTIILSVHDREQVDMHDSLIEHPATGYRGRSEVNKESRTYFNEKIADEDDYKASLEKYVVWDLETATNFIMNGKGEIKDPETGEFKKINIGEVDDAFREKITSEFIIESGRLPFIDVAGDKDFTFFIRDHHSVTDFTIEFNASLSDYADTNHMQSKAQAIIKGPAELIANEIQVGSHLVLKLVKQFDEQGREVDMDFSYANPNPDMAGAKEFIEALLALYLSSRDVDASEVTTKATSDRYNSGFERFLAIFETFSASKDDFEVYKNAEEELHEIVANWINVAKQFDGVLNPEYITAGDMTEAELMVEFTKPQEVKSTMQLLDEIQKEIELGLTSRVKALAKYRNISEDSAKEVIAEIDEQEGLNGVVETQVQQEGSESEVQS